MCWRLRQGYCERRTALREKWEAMGCGEIEIDDSEAGGLPLMAAADFVLLTDPGAEISTGSTPATRLARQARRPN